MSRLSDAKKAVRVDKVEREDLYSFDIQGAFSCQICQEQIDDAKFFPTMNLLKYVCSHGHKSYVENYGG